MHKQMGWDIGGAHLKAVLLSADGQIECIQQVACPLWLGLARLEASIAKILNDFSIDPNACRHAVTMTGELVDLFSSRDEGVVQISQLAAKLLGSYTQFYCMNNRVSSSTFLALADVSNHTKLVASANWHVSATLIAKHMPDAILIDIGSTTTDIITIEGGRVVDGGLTDAERMQQDTLIYTGIVRTPVMAVAQKLMFEDIDTNVAAEYFATMADVYRLTEELMPGVDMTDTADGEAKTLQASAKRLARMVGYDAEDRPLPSWVALANTCRKKQLAQIYFAAKKHLTDDMKIVGAGAGSFLAKAIAKDLNHPYVALSDLVDSELKHELAVCLPAYAVAYLAFLNVKGNR